MGSGRTFILLSAAAIAAPGLAAAQDTGTRIIVIGATQDREQNVTVTGAMQETGTRIIVIGAAQDREQNVTVTGATQDREPLLAVMGAVNDRQTAEAPADRRLRNLPVVYEDEPAPAPAPAAQPTR